jgi:hypothetical protein
MSTAHTAHLHGLRAYQSSVDALVGVCVYVCVCACVHVFVYMCRLCACVWA